MVAMGLRTGCGKEAVMVAALMAEDFCMLAGELSTSIDELRSVVVQTVLKPMKLISYETYTRLCSSEWSLLSVAEVTTWRAKGTEM